MDAAVIDKFASIGVNTSVRAKPSRGRESLGTIIVEPGRIDLL